MTTQTKGDTMTTEARAVIEAAVALYYAQGGTPGLRAGDKLDKATAAYLKSEGREA